MSKDTPQQVESVKDAPSYEDLLGENQTQGEQIKKLKARIAWFEKQVFGSKSERRVDGSHQLLLEGLLGEHVPPEPEETETITYQRGKAKKNRADDCVTDEGLRFNEDVPVEVIEVSAPELNGPDADQYEVIGTKVQHRLAQRPASYVVLAYHIPVIKQRDTALISQPSAPAQVLDRSLADVSVLAGLLVDKFQYHLPLYRQHQRMDQAGITLSRASLTNWVKPSIDLLKPIVDAQLQHMLLSKVLAMDETAIKAGRAKGKMKAAWFWPLMSEDEIVFTYSPSRGKQQIEKLLNDVFEGTLISDGYAAYARYVAATEKVTHAQCWSHTRRQFLAAEEDEPERVAEILALIRELYWFEEKHQKLEGEKLRAKRLEESQPVVEDPDVPLDTNHLERQIRAIPMGKKNWMFAWTELGAEHIGIIQSLICTCKLQAVNPYVYLVDVLHRINLHPAKEVEDLTPRVWREKLARKPRGSGLDQVVNSGRE